MPVDRYLNTMKPFLKEGQHLWKFVVRVYIVHCAAALLQQPDNVLVLNLLMHLELLKCGAQGLEKWAEIIVVGEVGVGQLWKKNYQIRSLRYFLQNKSSHKIHVIYVSVAVGRIRHVTRNTMFIYTWYVYVKIVAVCQSVKSSVL